MENLVAIDRGGSSVKYAKVSILGDITDVFSTKVDNENIENFYESITNIINELKNDKTIGIAISSPGSVDSNTKIIGGISAVPCIHDNDWLLRLEQETNLKCSVLNDANCALLAEVWMGNASDCRSALSFVIGSGIGGSIYTNGSISVGANLYGGEFGYMLFDQTRSVSDVVSTNALVNRVKSLGYDVNTGLDVFKYYDHNDSKVVEEVLSYYKDIAYVLYNLQHSIDPSTILLGGALSNREEIVQYITKYYNEIKNKLKMSDIDINLKTCKFNNNSNLLGAVKYFLDNKGDNNEAIL